MNARDIMTRNVITASPDTRVADIARLLAERHVSAVPVVDGDKVVGIVSEGDLVRRSEIGTDRRGGSWWLRLFRTETPIDFVKAHGQKARDIMTSQVVSVGEDTPVSEIADIFESKHIKRVPVVSGGRLVGIVSRANLVRAIASAGEKAVASAKASDREIRDRLTRTLEAQPWWNKFAASVNVSDGIVHYWGVTGANDDRKAARVAAEEIPGVKGVEDHRVDYSIMRAE
jgi:CBS domain-containing protein